MAVTSQHVHQNVGLCFVVLSGLWWCDVCCMVSISACKKFVTPLKIGLTFVVCGGRPHRATEVASCCRQYRGLPPPRLRLYAVVLGFRSGFTSCACCCFKRTAFGIGIHAGARDGFTACALSVHEFIRKHLPTSLIRNPKTGPGLEQGPTRGMTTSASSNEPDRRLRAVCSTAFFRARTISYRHLNLAS